MNEGFGQYKNVAIDLLKKTIDILNEFDINHLLISGTLLGYVRHNDFIPWDEKLFQERMIGHYYQILRNLIMRRLN